MKEYKLNINGNDYQVAVNDLNGNRADVTVNGTNYTVTLDQEKAVAAKPVAVAAPAPAQPAPAAAAKPAAGGGAVKSPLPGVILDIKVAVGDAVKVGQRLMVLEAMKMETPINAPEAGVLAKLEVAEGQQVQSGALLAVIKG